MDAKQLAYETPAARASILARHNEVVTIDRVVAEIKRHYPDNKLPVLVKVVATGETMNTGHDLARDGILRGAFELVPHGPVKATEDMAATRVLTI